MPRLKSACPLPFRVRGIPVRRPTLLPPASFRRTLLQHPCLRLSFPSVRVDLDFARYTCHNTGHHHLAAGPSPAVGLGSLAAEAGRSIKAMIKIYPFTFLFIFLVLGCENNPPDNVYRATEIDSLSFLLKNSDLIALVKISDGMPTTDKPAKKFKEVVAAEIVESFYGDIEDNDIKILNTPVHTTPGIVEHQLYFSNGEFIYFLKKFEGSYKPLTPFSSCQN